MSRLDANAREWRPSAPHMGPLELPSSSAAHDADSDTYPTEYPTEAPRTVKPAYNALAPEFVPSYARAGAMSPADTGTSTPTHAHAGAGLPSYATLAAGADGSTGIDWAAEFAAVMALTGQLIYNQRFGEPEAAASAAAAGESGPAEAASTNTPEASANEENTEAQAEQPVKPSYAAVVSGSSPARATPPPAASKAAAPATTSDSKKSGATSCSPATATPAVASSAASLVRSVAPPSMEGGVDGSVSEAGRPRHWKKQTKAQQRREMEQKNAFESFANALLHSVSPFMAPLRARCHTSLPHLKLDQRFGKSGMPQTAIAQFVVAPLITNYRPRHFHDVTPGDLMEFHYDLSQVLRVVTSSKSLHIGYGPVWKRFAIPYLYLACGQYRKEVLSLCPDEVPNSRAEAIYEDDIVKDITEVVLSVEELKPLQSMSIRQAMKLRVNLAPLYDAFEAVFQPLENYMIEITDFDKVPSTFLLKTSKLEVEQRPQPIVLYGDETLWYELPAVSRVLQLGGADSDTGVTSSAVNGVGSAVSGAATAAAPIAQSRGVALADAPATSTPAASAAAPAPRAEASVGAPGAASGHGANSVNWVLVAPVALSAFAVAATATILVLKKK